MLDSKGVEMYRIEGYLPKDEFEAQLEMGLGRIAFKAKRWANAENSYNEVLENYPNTSAAHEARYWWAVSRYKSTKDHTVLGTIARELQEKAPESVWAKKAWPWLTD